MKRSIQKNIRAIFADASRRIELDRLIDDPPPELPRTFGDETFAPREWPGAPVNQLPPGCPVVPLGKSGGVSYLIDNLGQLREIEAWTQNEVMDLFALQPNYPGWAWGRFAKPKATKANPNPKPTKMNGLETKEAIACLMKACARRGLFDPANRIRGRGGWADRQGRFIWHSGGYLWTVQGGKLMAAEPGELDGMFYPRRADVLTPWEEPVTYEDTPAHELFAALRTWTFERPALDPLLILGAVGCGLLGGALPWRPTVFMTGDRGVGKSTMQDLIKGTLADALHTTAETTAAGIYQRLGQDALPVWVDELEAGEKNDKVRAVVALARLSSSGALMYRGGADHKGTEFRAMNSYFFSSINPPPMSNAEKSRMAMVNLGKLDRGRMGDKPVISEENGRMLLRQLMDEWPRLPAVSEDWKEILKGAGFDSRQFSTYGTLLAVAQLMLGDEAFEAAGLPIDDDKRLGEMIRMATVDELADQRDNWRDCLEHLLGSTIEGSWKGGDKPTIGGVLENLERGANEMDTPQTRERLALVGLGLKFKDGRDDRRGFWLCVPGDGPLLRRIFYGTKWADGVWWGALKQAPPDLVLRGGGKETQVKINRVNTRCLLVDLAAYDAWCKREAGEG